MEPDRPFDLSQQLSEEERADLREIERQERIQVELDKRVDHIEVDSRPPAGGPSLLDIWVARERKRENIQVAFLLTLFITCAIVLLFLLLFTSYRTEFPPSRTQWVTRCTATMVNDHFWTPTHAKQHCEVKYRAEHPN